MILRRPKKTIHPEADKALQEASQHYAEVDARTEEVHEVAEAIKHISKRNHFAERIQAIMEGEISGDR